jgi:hypothetical protein
VPVDDKRPSLSGAGGLTLGAFDTDGRPVPRITVEGMGRKWTEAKRGTREHMKHEREHTKVGHWTKRTEGSAR